MSDANTMLVAGPGGGKSTFIGALYHKMSQKSDDIHVNRKVPIGDEAEIKDNVIDRMQTKRMYPKQTTSHYVVRMKIDFTGDSGPGVTTEFIDIPGEEQANVLDTIEEGNLDRSAALRTYHSELKEIIESEDRQLMKDDQWEDLYRYSYVKSDRVLFLFNLYKVFHNQEDDLVYNARILETVANEMPCAVVVTALDSPALQYDPDASPSGTDPGGGLLDSWAQRVEDFWEGTSHEDDDLVNLLRNRLPQVDDEANNIIQTAQMNPNIDLFGVSVPAENPTEKEGDLKADGTIGFETRGFDQVVDWLRR